MQAKTSTCAVYERRGGDRRNQKRLLYLFFLEYFLEVVELKAIKELPDVKIESRIAWREIEVRNWDTIMGVLSFVNC